MTKDFRDRWVAAMRKSKAGHAPSAEGAVDASISEARELFELGLFRNGSRVLDVGSGNGRTAVGLLPYGLAEYVGIEPVRACVEFSRAAFAGQMECGFLWVDVRTPETPKGTIDPLDFRIPFGDGHFDAVIAGSLFTHLSTLAVAERYLSEMHRVLRDGGGLWASFFLDPPNKGTESYTRTVFPVKAVTDLLAGRFSVLYERGGKSTGHHDQWCVYGRKIPGAARP